MADCPVCELHAESVFRIEGMDCHEEVTILEHRLKALTGLEALDADVVGQRLRIQYDAAKLTTSRIAEAVAQTGMRAWLEHEEPRPTSSSVWRERLVLLSGMFLALGLALQLAGAPALVWLLLDVAAVVLAGTQTARRAWTSLTAGHLDIHVLMMVAVAGRDRAGRLGRGCVGGVSLRACASARSAGDGARQGCDSCADGPGARPRRSSVATDPNGRYLSTASASATS